VPVSPKPVPDPAPEPGGGARDDSPPAIAHGWVEHRRLVQGRHGRCDDEPRTSDVTAVVQAPGGVRSVTVRLRGDGRDISVDLVHAGGPAWAGRIGPFDGDTRGRYDVVVEAVGADGTQVVKKIGEVCVTRCGDRAS
jgi:hypothetical protein